MQGGDLYKGIGLGRRKGYTLHHPVFGTETGTDGARKGTRIEERSHARAGFLCAMLVSPSCAL